MKCHTPGQQDKKGAPAITYSYDQRGNRLTMDRSDVGLSTYSYDQISQLLTAALPDGDFQTYTFDPVGNRLSLEDSRGTQVYRYDEADQLLEVESDFNPEEPDMKGKLLTRLGASDASRPLFMTTYGWDADGNQVSKTGPGNKTSRYDFDELDRLVGISAPGSEPEQYRYDADMQRVATVRGKDSMAERFLHLGRGRQVLGDLDGQGKMTKRYILLPSGQLLAHVDSAGNKPAFYHFDALGSTVVLSDSSNRITARFAYDPYGVRSSFTERYETYGYVAQEGVTSSPNSLLEMGLRFYQQETGRFLTRELLCGMGILTHPYHYADGNPVRYIDPTGLYYIPGVNSTGPSPCGSDALGLNRCDRELASCLLQAALDALTPSMPQDKVVDDVVEAGGQALIGYSNYCGGFQRYVAATGAVVCQARTIVTVSKCLDAYWQCIWRRD